MKQKQDGMELNLKNEENIIQGKKGRALGIRFELKVRKDLESKGWIVDKWSNNVDLEKNKLIPAKHKFRGIGRPLTLGVGFPDFICLKTDKIYHGLYNVIGVESKFGKYLKKEEKEKVQWLLKNNIFSKILVAYKDKNKRGEILYEQRK